jgi:hypothetical protein
MFSNLSTLQLCIKRNALKKEQYMHEQCMEGGMDDETESTYSNAIKLYQDEIDKRGKDS